MTTVLLAGCGSIGLTLGSALQAAGFNVIGLRRSAVAAHFPMLQADFTQPLDPALFTQPVHYVVHTATPGERSDAGYEKAYPGSLKHLLQALHGHPLKRFFFVSSTAVYAQDAGEWVDETSVTAPVNFNGTRMLEAEQVLLNSGVPATCVRFGGIYGQGRNFLLRRVQSGAQVQHDPPSYTNRIHQDDCVGMLKFLLEKCEAGAPLEPVYLGVDSDPASEETVCAWLAQQLGAPAPVLKSAPAGAPQNKRCSNARIRQLGYTFRYPDFRSGYRAVLANQ
jgi:nucleoside-diphosphate-sugar epimerase